MPKSRSRAGFSWKQEYGGVPAWGIAVAVVAMFGMLAVPAVVNATTPAAAPYVRPSDAFTEPTPDPEPAAVVFVGDSYTGGSEFDSGADVRWPALVSAELGVSETVLARGGSGYVAVGPSGETIGAVVPEIPATTDLVVIYGSRNDVAPEEEVYAASAAMLAAVKTQAPEARILVVGPSWIDANVPRNLLGSDAALTRAAADAGVDYASALTVLSAGGTLIGADGVHPTDEGHAVLASFMLPLVQERLPQD